MIAEMILDRPATRVPLPVKQRIRHRIYLPAGRPVAEALGLYIFAVTCAAPEFGLDVGIKVRPRQGVDRWLAVWQAYAMEYWRRFGVGRLPPGPVQCRKGLVRCFQEEDSSESLKRFFFVCRVRLWAAHGIVIPKKLPVGDTNLSTGQERKLPSTDPRVLDIVAGYVWAATQRAEKFTKDTPIANLNKGQPWEFIGRDGRVFLNWRGMMSTAEDLDDKGAPPKRDPDWKLEEAEAFPNQHPDFDAEAILRLYELGAPAMRGAALRFRDHLSGGAMTCEEAADKVGGTSKSSVWLASQNLAKKVQETLGK